jgi:hypothetical protein
MDAREASTGDRGAARVRSLLRRAPWLLSPLLYPLFHALAPVLPDALRALLSFVLVVLLPGWLLLRLILPRANVGLPGHVARSFILGLALVSALGLAAWFFGGDTGLGPVAPPDAAPPPLPGRLSAILWGEAAFLVLGGLFLRRSATSPAPRGGRRTAGGPVPGRGREPSGALVLSTLDGPSLPGDESETLWQRIVREAYRLGEQHRRSRSHTPTWVLHLALGAILALASGLAFYAGGNFGYDTDAPAHIAGVREMIERDRVLPRTAFYADGDGVSVDPRFGTFHVALAVTSRLAGLDPARMWDLLPGVLAPLALVVFYALARRLLRSESVALFAVLLALITFGDAGRGMFSRLAYGNYMGIVLTWGVLAFSMHFALGDTRPAALGLVALGAFAAVATHVFSVVAIGFALGTFLLALLLLRGIRHAGVVRAARVLLAALAGALPPLLWRMRYASATINPLHTQSQGLLHLGDGLFVFQPGLWWPYLGGVGALGALLGLLLWRRVREGDAEIYLAALSLAPFLVLLNPVLPPALEPTLGYLVARVASLVPFLLVLAYLSRAAGQSLLDLDSRRRVLQAVVFLVLLAAVLVPRVQAFARSYASAPRKALRARSVLHWEGLLRRLDAEIDSSVVILSDPLTGYSIPALTRHSTVSVLHQHGSPADSLALERLRACRDVLSPYLGTGEKARVCRRFGVDYVLVNTSIARTVNLYACHVEPALAWQQREALESDRELFQRAIDYGARGALYRVRRERLDALCGIVNPGEVAAAWRTTERTAESILWRSLPAEARPVLPDTVAGITLAAITFDASRVARGDSLGMTLYWRRVGPAPRGPLASRALSRLDRAWVQRRRHVLYRWRMPSPPVRGAFGPEHWPRDRYVADRVRFAVPLRCATGEYVVRVRWEEPAFLPNLRLSQYLSDAAAPPSAAVGVLEVY